MSAPAPVTRRSGHDRPAGAALTRWGVLTVLLALLAVLGVAPSAVSAPSAGTSTPPRGLPAAPGGNDVQVRLEAVTPGVASPGTPIELRGTLRNLGTARIPTPVVVVRRASTGLETRRAIADWANGSSDADPGAVIARRAMPTTLLPGQTMPFRVTIGRHAIDTVYRFTTLALTLQVRTGTSPSATTIGSLRTFLPWDRISPSEHNPIAISWVVPLTLPADPALFGPASPQRASAWERAIGPGSPIDRLVAATYDQPVTWAVDPTAVDPPASLHQFGTPGAPPTSTGTPSGTPTSPTSPPTSGSPTTPPPTTAPSTTPPPEGDTSPTTPGTTGTSPTASAGASTGATSSGLLPPPSSAPTSETPGPSPGSTPPTTTVADELGDELATRLRTATDADHPLWALPYGDPDLTTLLHLDPDGSTLQSALRKPTPTSLGTQVRSGIAWPIDPTLGRRQVATLRRAWKSHGKHGSLRAAVISARAVDGRRGLTGSAPRKSAQGLPLLAYDDRLSGIFSAMDDPTDGGAAVQRFLAETLAVYQERPAWDRSLLVVPPRTFRGDPTVLRQLFTGVASAPWLRPTSTDTLLRQAGKASRVKKKRLTGGSTAAAPGDLTAYPSAHASPLTKQRLAGLSEVRHTTAGVSSILDPGEGYQAIWSAATDQLLSSRWRVRRSAWPTLRQRVVDANQQVLQGVSVVPSTFNFFADEGSLQLTVVNSLGVGVRDVGLRLTPRNPRLRIIKQAGPLRIGPKSRTTVKVKVNAISAGLVPVDADLSAPNGTTVGAGTSVTVRVQPTSTWIYWVLGIVAGLILVLGLFRALRRGGQRPTDPSEQIEETPDT